METINTTEESANRIAISMYVGQECTECSHKFISVNDLIEKDPICTGRNPLRFACRKCVE